MFCKGETLSVAGGQKGLAVVAVCQCVKINGFSSFRNSGNFYTSTVLELLSLAGKDGQ
jgi:hypothetical protein